VRKKMPPYCKTCPYNEFCENKNVSEALCPMGYVPTSGSNTLKTISGTAEEPLDPEVLIKIGKTAYNNDEYEQALKSYSKVLEVDPTHQEAQFLKKRTEYIIAELSRDIEAGEKPETEHEDKGSPLTLVQEPSIKVGHSEVVYYDSVKKVPLESKDVLTVRDATREKRGIAKSISIRTHGSIMKKKGTEIIIGFVMAFLVFMVIMLFLTGHLKF
jgi:hypothetical protein